MKILPAGDLALLVDLDGPEERRRADAAIRSLRLPTVDHVPAATTVLLRFATSDDLRRSRPLLDGLELGETPDLGDGTVVTIPVRYDGADLDAVAEHLGLDRPGLIAWHTERTWSCDFVGFLPGFAYLVADREFPPVPRLATPRTRIPPGAVAMAGPWCGIYPAASPGGWRLIGTTDAPLWDDLRTPPGLIAPGAVVRFTQDRDG